MNGKDAKIVVDPAQQALAANWPSVNALVAGLVRDLVLDAPALRLGIERGEGGCVFVDGGIAHRGGMEAGRRIAAICMAGLGTISLQPSGFKSAPFQVVVHSADPVLACLGSQYAGWSLSHGKGKGAFHALGSGPGRAAAGKEALFEELGYRDLADSICLVLEVDQRPPAEVVNKISQDCGVATDKITLILTPTRSLAGTVQIVARVLEVALHKVHALGFPLHQVVDGIGSAPLPPPAKDFLTAMGRTNDAILFGGKVQLFVDCGDDEAAHLAASLPSGASRDYGKPFAQVFKEAEYDFYRIDPHLFAPAAVSVTTVKSGKSFHAGAMDEALLDLSFGANANG